MIDYQEWKNSVVDRRGPDSTSLYWPNTTNFMPVTGPVFVHENKVYTTKTQKFNTQTEIENYLNDHDDIALFYITTIRVLDKTKYAMRFAHLETQALTPITVEQFFKRIQDQVNASNEKFGTLEGLKNQVENLKTDLGFVYWMKHQTVDNTIHFSMQGVVTDRNLLYV